jgi:cytochrome c biogenesis protein CcdA
MKRVWRHFFAWRFLESRAKLNFGTATYGLALLAGALSILSPCVLPLIPVLAAGAVAAHRFGPLVLAAGLAMSFTVVGLVIATFGASLGLDPDILRTVGALLLTAFGVVLLVPRLQDAFARLTTRVGDSGNHLLARITGEGLTGQFLVGSVLGLVWSPCVGPTLGAAITLAGQGKSLPQICLLMLVFGIGAAAPLVALGSLSRARFVAIRGRLLSAGRHGKQVFGLLLVGTGILIATGVDKSLEARILDWSPEWLTRLTTRF